MFVHLRAGALSPQLHTQLLYQLFPNWGARSLGMDITDDELKDMIVEFDQDKDGMISEAEFMVRRGCGVS